ncbi:unnamed protein product [Adineta ricciae]|uniref:Alanine racemase n=1 Tax=Adineta ricciae TaxID=249248 RepID=A0A813Z0T3_ADIRI|nr:unnamed protein product [Adineta ricciae]CAF1301931.1 unnamed protein product [Adineta ricciae]
MNIIYHSTHSSPIINSTISPSKIKTKELPPPYLRPTWIDVDLDLVRINVLNLKKYIGDNVHLMAVVKANAYGYGIMEIARTSLSAGATWIGVATLDEALVLRREIAKHIPILVLGYVPVEHLSRASEANVTITGISLEWLQEADQAIEQPVDFHLKIDTGMNRLGCRTEDEVKKVIDIVSRNPKLRFTGAFTHFATSEDLTNRTYFLRQLNRFKQFLEIIPNRSEKLIHCSNSGATLYHDEKPFYNMVRCGKALTGPPNEPLKAFLPIKLQSVISLHSVLSLVKEVEAGEKIGYADTYTTTKKQWIGTVPIGYGDGWHQNLKPTGVLVEGQRMEIVGRISMDQLMVALDHEYPVGTRVTFIGQQGNMTITGDEVASAAKIPRSEVFSAISSRVPRIYKDNNTIIIPNSAHRNVFQTILYVLPMITIASSDSRDSCAICLSALVPGPPVLTLSCNHKFHLQCLAASIQAQNKQCPLCRVAIDATVVQLLIRKHQSHVQQQQMTHFNLFGFPTNPLPPVHEIPSVEDPVDENALRTLSDQISSARQAAAAAMAPMGNRPMITITTALEYSTKAFRPESNIYGMVTLQAPPGAVASVNASPVGSRVPIDLICVVDQSDSMAGDKMQLLKQTLIYITDQLNDLDRLALVSFDTRAFDRSHGLKRMNRQNQQILTRAINNDLHSAGGTYIGSGLQMGINLLNTRRTKNPIAALLLLTDGQDNHSHYYGQLLSTLPTDVQCHTFGYGPDHLAALLVQIAEKGNNGSFTYIDQQEAVGRAFAMTLGGLFSCIAKQLQVEIKFNEPYAITHVHSIYPHTPENLPCKRLGFKLNDLNADEKRNLIFQLHIPEIVVNETMSMDDENVERQDGQAADIPQIIGQVSVTYVDTNTNQTLTTTPVPFQLMRTLQSTAGQLPVNYNLDLQRNRVETAREIKRAMDERDYQRSREILQAQVNKIKASVSGKDQFCQLLIRDLEHHYPSENAYRSSHFNTYMQHSTERGTYAPLTTFSSAVYLSVPQEQQAAHFGSYQQIKRH